MYPYPGKDNMKAMVLEKSGEVSKFPLSKKMLQEPEPGIGEVRVKVDACGVCRTDLHIVEGDLPLPKLPLIPGHQVVGRVDSLGEGSGRFATGDRVGVAWLNSACGQCRYCKSGTENLCKAARFTGYHVDGGYARSLIVPEQFAYRIPDGFSDNQAAPLLCAGIIGYRALRLSGIQPGGRLGLFGFGASAHVTIQVARHMGCDVYVFSRGEGRRTLAEELGAVWTGEAGSYPDKKLEAAIVFAPAGAIVHAALESVGPGGTVALAGIHMTPIPELNYEKHLFYEKTLRSVTASTRYDGQKLFDLAAEIPIRTEVTTFPLTDANDALVELKEGKINGAGVLVL
jgi:propanol-preferring alcohol dehydrogenase